MSEELAVGQEGSYLPIEVLERSVGPVRRSARWASAQAAANLEGKGVRPSFVEANLGRFLDVLLAESRLAPEVRELVVEAREALRDCDQGTDAGLSDALAVVSGVIARIDSVFGLPPERLPLKPSPRRHAVREGAVKAERVSGPKPKRPERESGRSERRPDAELRASPEARVAEATDEDDEEGEETGPSLATPLDELVGAEQALGLAEHGLYQLGDLLELNPLGEERLRPIHGAGRVLPDGRVAVGGRARLKLTRCQANGGAVHELVLVGAGPLRVVFEDLAQAEAVQAALAEDPRVILVGEAMTEGPRTWLASPELAVNDGRHGVRLQQYGLAGVPDRLLRALISSAIPLLPGSAEPLPADLIERQGLLGRPEALAALHTVGGAAPAARTRMVFEELLIAELGLAAERYQQTRERGISHLLSHGRAARLAQALDLELPDAAALVLEEMKRDLRANTAMQRVVVGDAGVGRGILTLMAICLLADSKAQTLVVCGSAAEAERKLMFMEPLLQEAGLVSRLVVGDPGRAVRDAVKRGEVHVVFGTTAILADPPEFRRLGLVIAWEDAPYGAITSRMDKLKPRPDLLIFPASPVAPEILLAAYPRCEVSRFHAAGSQRVKVKLCLEAERAQIYSRASEAVSRGEQVMVLFPMVDGKDALSPTEAMRVVRALQDAFPVGTRIALFHGAATREELQHSWDDFRHRRQDVLVATLPVEEAPTAPGVSTVIVEQAGRVQSERLPRLIGQLTRGERQGHLVLVLADEEHGETRERLQVLVDAPDGMAFGRAELARMGVEALVATQDVRMPRWRRARLDVDGPLWLKARMEAHQILGSDPKLRRPIHAGLANMVRAQWPLLWPGQPDSCPIAPAVEEDGERKRKRRRRRRKGGGGHA